MLILENQNTEQQHEQMKQFTVMMAATTVGMKRSHEEADDDDNGSFTQIVMGYEEEHLQLQQAVINQVSSEH